MREKEVAKKLLEIKAIFLRPNEPFIWSSGIKTPIYCDNRLILSYPDVRKIIEKELANLIKEKFSECEGIMGTSTAGIGHAAIVADILNLPMGYVRTKNKEHGRKNKIEGLITENQKIVVIEDLISTGGSCIEVVNALREVGADVLGIVSIFTYDMEVAKENLKAANITNYSCTNYDQLITVAIENGYIKKEEKEQLLQFRNNPSGENWDIVRKIK